MKYIVMECHLSYAVVLNEEGCFLKVANRHYEVGQTVTDIIEMQVPPSVSQKKKTNKWVYSLVAMAACLILMVTSMFQMGQMTYASVYMTINPEVRIDVNRNDVVVKLDGINSDGDDLIAGYEYKKKDLDLVMDELVARAIDMGYLYEGGQISLVLDADSDEWVNIHRDTLTAQLNEHLNEKLSVTIEVTDMKEQGNKVVLPVTPKEGDYGESDYEDTNKATAPPASPQPAESDYGDSSYDDGQTDYDESDDMDDSQSDYKTEDSQSDYEDFVTGQSDYGSDYIDNDDSQSDYGEDEKSDYDDYSDYDDD
ncbi:MAG: anti-sigma factor domain-containing protein [Ruminococcus sp.]|nr:anti-sigma factor domain-containing protein [Ruminococcus sp.]